MGEEHENRINIEDLARPEEELTDEDAKNVQGGAIDSRPGVGILKSTDSGKTWTSTTIGGSLGANSGNTVGGSLAVDPSNPNKP